MHGPALVSPPRPSITSHLGGKFASKDPHLTALATERHGLVRAARGRRVGRRDLAPLVLGGTEEEQIVVDPALLAVEELTTEEDERILDVRSGGWSAQEERSSAVKRRDNMSRLLPSWDGHRAWR